MSSNLGTHPASGPPRGLETIRQLRGMSRSVLILSILALSLLCASPASAQKKKKSDAPPPPVDTSKLMASLSDEQQIDYMLSEMLAAWQLGDADKLHKDYADDVVVVNGQWAPPTMGWTSYLAIYQSQRARMMQVRMDRSNTYIKVSGTIGWACYQWEFAGIVDGQQTESHGQTTVVMEKRDGHWLIVLNHTSLAPVPPKMTPPSAPSGQQPPQKP
jgi:ketosteroid isomerase-like protein